MGVYRKQRNLATAISKQSKLAYFRERCDGGPKNQSFWRTIKPFLSDKSASFRNKIILQEGDKIINDTHEIYEIFNTYFTTVANNIGFDDSIPPDFYTHGFSAMIYKHCQHPNIVNIRENISNDLVFDFQCVNANDISNIIKSFDGKKAHAYDMVPINLLQKSAQHIAPDIARLINNSVSESIFPGDLKFAEVSSLFKKKDNLNKINYRPVSILIALSKIYEKAMSLQLTDHFNHIFAALLSAIRKGYSIGTDTNIEVIVVSLTTWEAHHSPRAKPKGCGELPRSLMRQQWPKLRYQFLFYHDETKLMMNKQILSI